MKELFNKFLTNLHWVIIAWGLYGVYIKYEEHAAQITAIDGQVASVEAEKVTTQKSIEEISDSMKKIDEFKVRVEEVAKNIEAVQRQLPPDINDSQILDFLNQEMSLLNIKQSQLIPGNEVTSTYFVSKDYNFKSTGTFLQFLIFFERIGTAARIYNIKSLKLTTDSSNQKGRFQLVELVSVIQAFRYNPDFKVDLGFEKTDAAVKE